MRLRPTHSASATCHLPQELRGYDLSDTEAEDLVEQLRVAAEAKMEGHVKEVGGVARGWGHCGAAMLCKSACVDCWDMLACDTDKDVVYSSDRQHCSRRACCHGLGACNSQLASIALLPRTSACAAYQHPAAPLHRCRLP